MKQTLYQVDAFTDSLFSGNPAAVCVLDQWWDAHKMQMVARENNLAETAFVVKTGQQYEIRWFTPETEVDLCGHATLAAAFVLLHYYETTSQRLLFDSPRSGKLSVEKSGEDYLMMDFPKDDITIVNGIDAINKAIGLTPHTTIKGKTDYLLIYNSQKDIERITPNFYLLDQLDCRGVIVSALGDTVDFVSRFFAPQCGIPEDPVTGSAHTTLIPYWSNILGKNRLTAKQVSPRGGEILCEDHGDRVKISGKAVLYLAGTLEC